MGYMATAAAKCDEINVCTRLHIATNWLLITSSYRLLLGDLCGVLFLFHSQGIAFVGFCWNIGGLIGFIVYDHCILCNMGDGKFMALCWTSAVDLV